MLEFKRDSVALSVEVKMNLSENDIETIIVNGFEGGVGYWVRHVDDKIASGKGLRDGKPKDEPLSTWVTKLLLEGETVYLIDDDDDKLPLDLERIGKGFSQNYQERPWDNNLEQGDATTADCIIQYAVFGKLVYG